MVNNSKVVNTTKVVDKTKVVNKTMVVNNTKVVDSINEGRQSWPNGPPSRQSKGTPKKILGFPYKNGGTWGRTEEEDSRQIFDISQQAFQVSLCAVDWQLAVKVSSA